MASAVKYLSNVGKSIKYATIDAIKDMNPVISDAIETNSDVVKATYDTVKNFKAISNKAYRSIADSEVGRLGKEGIHNLFTDLRHGTFYNRERRDKATSDFFENEWANDDAFSFDTGDDNFGGENDSFGMDDLADTIDAVGEKSSSAVSQVIARSADYQIRAQKQSTAKLVAAQSAMSSMLHADLATVNTNIGNLLQFNTQHMATHINNSASFYARQQEQMSEQTAILKELLEVTKRNFEPQDTKKSSKKITMADILTSEGNLDIKTYAKYIKQNMSSSGSGMFEAMGDALKSGAKEVAASPLSFVMTAAVKKFIPGMLKESMESLNTTMSSVMSNILLKMTDVDDEDSIFGKIKSIFGLKERYKHGYDVGAYNKGKAQWTGKDHKALTEVIPILLSKIYSAVSETDELRYDYNTGKFVKALSIKETWKNQRRDDIRAAGGDMYTAIMDEIKKMQFANAADREQLQADLDKIMEYNLTNMKAFNRNHRKTSAADYGLVGTSGEYNYQLIKDIIKRMPKGRQLEMQQARSIMNVITNSHSRSRRYEEEGDSIYNILHDGSFDSSRSRSKKAPTHKLSSLDYLQGINKEVAYIRELLTEALPRIGSGRGKGGRPTQSSLPSFSSYSFYGDKEKHTDTTSTTRETQIDENGGFVYGSGSYDVYAGQKVAQKIDEEKAKKTFLDKMVQANTLSEKFKVIMGGVNDLAKAPAKFLAGVISKTDQRIYHMLFGEGGKDGDDESTIMGKIGASMNRWLDQITEETKGRWENLKGKFSKEKVSEFFQKFMAGFGLDKDAMNHSATEYFFGEGETSFFGGIKNMFKKGFSNIWGGIKNSFKSVWGWAKPARDEIFGVKNEKGQLKEQRNREAREFNSRIRSFAGVVDELDAENSIEQAAAGMRRVRKTGLVAVSAGEMIVPPDMNPYNIRKRAYNEQLAIRKYEKFFGKKNSGIRSYAAGTNWTFYNANQGSGAFDINNITPRDILKHQDDTQWFTQFPADKEQLRILFARLKSQEWGTRAIDLIKKKLREISQNSNQYRRQRESFTREDYDADHLPLHYRMADTARAGMDEVRNQATDLMQDANIKGMMDKLSKNVKDENFSEALSDVKNNLSKYLPDVAAGGVTGMGLSMMLGLMGGPLVGAAMGASIGLIKNSEKVQKWLFGEEIIDKDGNKSRKGGLISADLSTKITKYFPDMSKGAIVGGITSILPFVPGGPIAGILLGSAVGFAKNNEAMKNSIFGEETAIGKGLKAIKQKLPKMGLGALVGAIAGPFGGLATNLLVGSAIGFASDTNKMKDLLYGKEGFDGVRHGGLAGAIKDHFNRATDMLKSIFKDFKKDFIDKDIVNPLKDFFKPLKQQGNLILRWIKSSIREAFVDKVGHRVGSFFYKFLVSSESKLGKLLFGKENEEGKRRGGLFGTAWAIGTSPFRALGGVGRSLRRHQLKTGRADDLTAEERLSERDRLFRNGTGQNRAARLISRATGGRLFGTGSRSYENWYSADQTMNSMDSETAGALADRIEQVQFYKNRKKYKSKMMAAYAKGPLDQLDSMVKKGECSDEAFRAIRKAISKGNVDTVRNMVKALPITPPEAKELAVKKLTQAAQKMKQAMEDWGSEEELREEMVRELQAAGFTDIDVNDPRAIERLVTNLRREQRAKEADADDKHLEQQEKTKQMKSPMYQIQEELRDGLFDRIDMILVKMGIEPPKRKNAPTVETVGPEDVEVLDRNGELIDRDSSDDTPTVGEEQISTSIQALTEVQQRVLTQLERQNNRPIHTSDSNGNILTYRTDADGSPILDHSNSENRETLRRQEEAQAEQKGIFSKIAAGFTSIFGGKKDNEEGSGSSKGGIFSKILSLGKSLFTNKLGLTIAGLATVGLMGMEVPVGNATDIYGNVIYDENGDPVKEKKTIGSIILDAGKKLWLGEDGTGNTSGMWFFIKDWSTHTLFPAIGKGMEWVFDKGIPWAVETLVSKLPDLLMSAIKGALSWFSSEDDDSPSASSINSGFTSSSGKTASTSAFGSGNDNPMYNISTQQPSGSSVYSSTTPTTSTGSTSIGYNNPPKSNSSSTTATASVNSAHGTGNSTSINNLSTAQKKAAKSKAVSVNNDSQTLKYANGAAMPNRIVDWVYSNWNSPTAWGVTLGELLQDNETILDVITDDDGNEIVLTGANILQYCSYIPQLGIQYLGQDLSLTDEERTAISKELGYDLPGDSAASKTSHAINNIIARGGSKNLRALNLMNKANTKIAKGLGKIPGIGRFAKGYYNATISAPGKIAAAANDMVYSTRVSGSMKTGAKTMWGNLRGNVMDPVTGEVLEAAPTKEKGRIRRTYDRLANSKLGQKVGEAKNAVKGKMANAVDNLKSKIKPSSASAASMADDFVEVIDDVDILDANGNPIAKVNGGATTTAIDNISNSNRIASAADDIGGAAAKTTDASTAISKIGGEAVSGEAAEAAAKATSGIKGFLTDNKVVKGLKDALGKISGKVTHISDDIIKKGLTEFAEKIGKKFAGKLGQMAAKAVAKVAAAVTPAVVVLVAEALIYFAKGCYDADIILGVKDPSALERILGGIINALNEVFLLGLLPLDDVVNTLWDVLCNIFPDLKNSDFNKRREELDAEVEAYNKANGTNLTEEEYLKKDKILYKVWNHDAMGVVRGVTGAVGDVVGGVVGGIGDVGGGIIDGGKKLLQGDILGGLGSIGGGVVKGVGSVVGGVVDAGKNIIGGAAKTVGGVVKGIGSGISKGFKAIGSFFGFGDDDEEEEKEKKTEQNSTAVQQMMDSETATVVNADGTVSTYPTLTQAGLPQQVISDSNQKLIDKTVTEVNSALPGMLTTYKNKLATLFGLNDGSGSGNLLSMAKNSVTSLVKHNPASVFMNTMKGVWTKLNSKAQDMNKQAVAADSTGASNAAKTISNTNSTLVKLTPVNSDTKLSSEVTSSLSEVSAAGSGVSGRGPNDPVLEKDPAITSFISQKYSKYASQPFVSTNGDIGTTTVSEAGCAPASASMLVNMNPLASKRLSMKDAIKHARSYKLPGAGVSADYFASELHSHGLDTAYVTSSNSSKNDIIINQLRKGNAVVLRGIDPDNTNKNKSPFGPTAHYVVATGISPDGQYIYINDPEAKDAKIAYPIDKVLKATDLGIIPTVNKLRKTSTAMLNKIKKTLKNYTAGAIGTIIYAGGSRTVGMKNAVGASSTIRFYTKDNAGVNWLSESNGAGDQVLKALESSSNAAVVFDFGIDDLNNIDSYIEYYTAFMSKTTSKNIWFMSANPVNERMRVYPLNRDVEEFNAKLKSFAGDRYIDTYTYLTGIGFNTSDGLLYDNDTYVKIHEYVVSKVGSSTSFEINNFTDTYYAFDELAKYYGLSTSTSSDGSYSFKKFGDFTGLTEEEAASMGISGNVSSDSSIASAQRALVAKMRSVEGKLKYAQGISDMENPGSRNPDEGSGDASSTIAWAYKSVTGKDVGSWTDAMRSSSSTYTVAQSLSDESQLQLGDMLLMDGHVEMYAGNKQMIGHGDPDKLGPTMKSLGSSPPYDLVRRLADFQGSGSGNTFVSQIGSYKNAMIGDETVAEAGCAPATATMATNILNYGTPNHDYTMDKAIKVASAYKLPGAGVSADYFVDQFQQNGFSTMMMGGSNAKDKITNMLRGKVGAVVLLGKNANNKSKSSSPFGPSNHYVLATKISSDGKYIWINDPEQKKTVKYPIDKVLPYVSLGIAPIMKGQDKKLDSASKKLASLLSQYNGGSYDEGTNEYIVWNYLTNAGYSAIIVAGIMGNIYGESGFNPKCVEKATGEGFGICQWSYGRKTKLYDYAKTHSIGKQSTSGGAGNIYVQLDFLLEELDPNSVYFQFYENKSNYYGCKSYDYDSFMSSTTITDATVAFMTCWERCTNKNFKQGATKRINAAVGYYEAFTGTTPDKNLIGELESSDGTVISSITDAYSYFDQLASAYGIGNLTGENSLSNNITGQTTPHKYLNQLYDWVGASEGDSTHKYIIDSYNKYKPDGEYTMGYDDHWCQATMSAAAGLTGNSNIVANSASTQRASKWYKDNGTWIDPADYSSHNAKFGDQIYFDTDNNGTVNHVGAVYDVQSLSANKATIIDGNWGNKVHKREISLADSTIYGIGRPNWPENNIDPETMATSSGRSFGGGGRRRGDSSAVEGSGSGILRRYNRFRNNPKAIGKFRGLSGRGSSNITIPKYSGSSNTTKILTTPNLSSTKNYKVGSSNRTTIVSQSNDTTNKLVDIVIKLLAQVVDNTTSIKDIAALLTALINDKGSTNKTTSSSDTTTKAMVLKALSDAAASNIQNSTLDSLIKNVEAIASQ